jgi:hypothetical protein
MSDNALSPEALLELLDKDESDDMQSEFFSWRYGPYARLERSTLGFTAEAKAKGLYMLKPKFTDKDGATWERWSRNYYRWLQQVNNPPVNIMAHFPQSTAEPVELRSATGKRKNRLKKPLEDRAITIGP